MDNQRATEYLTNALVCDQLGDDHTMAITENPREREREGKSCIGNVVPERGLLGATR